MVQKYIRLLYPVMILLGVVAATVLANVCNEKVHKLRDMNLLRIPVEAIPNDTTLLDLNNNDINYTDSSDFANFPCLQILILRENNLTQFPNLTLVSKTLRRLDIEYNLIENISVDDIKVLTHMETLKLSGNKFKSFPDVKILGNTLRVLDVNKRNKETSIFVPEWVKGLHVLYHFEFRNDNLTNFPNFTFIKDTISTIDLSGNLIEYIHPQLLDMLKVLSILRLGFNRLSEIPNVSGPGKALTALSLKYNLFRTFPRLFNLGSNLERLDFRGNEMLSIPEESLVFPHRENSDVLFKLFLTKTNVTTVPPIIGINFTSIFFDVTDAPITCDQRIGWVVSMKEQKGTKLIGNCNSPKHVQGKQLKRLTYSLLGITHDVKETQVSQKSSLIHNGVYSSTMPILKSKVLSVIQCIAKCSVAPGCMYVNYYKGDVENEDGTNCHYSSPLDGIKEPYDYISGEKWSYYSMDSK